MSLICPFGDWLKEDVSLGSCLVWRRGETGRQPLDVAACLQPFSRWSFEGGCNVYIMNHRGLDGKHGLGNFFFIDDSDFSFSLYLGLVSLPVTLDVSVEVCM